MSNIDDDLAALGDSDNKNMSTTCQLGWCAWPLGSKLTLTKLCFLLEKQSFELQPFKGTFL